MEPRQHFKKKIIGQLVTRTIDKLSIDGAPTSIKAEKIYNVIDIVQQGNHKLFVTNTWENEDKQVVLAIHNNFVKEHNCEPERHRSFIEQGFRQLGGEPLLKRPELIGEDD